MLPLLEFIETCRKRGTRDQYRQSLCLFFECLTNTQYEGRSRSKEHVEAMDLASIDYLSNSQDYTRDLLKFSTYLKKYSPSAKNSHVTTVIFWLEMNDIAIPKSKQMFIKNRVGRRKTTTKDHPLSHEDIRAWYEHCSRIARVVMLIQASSGMRIGEVLALMPEDIDWESSPVMITVRGTFLLGEISDTKNGDERICFISSEAAHSLKEWLKYRDSWFQSTCVRCGKGNSFAKNAGDRRIIPVVHNSIQGAYTRGLKKAELYSVDENTRRTTITSHSLRKFFITQAKTAMPAEIVEALAGHEGYLDGAYRRFPLEQMKQAYLSGEHAISILGGDMTAVREENKTIMDQLNFVLSDNARMRAEMEAITDMAELLKKKTGS